MVSGSVIGSGELNGVKAEGIHILGAESFITVAGTGSVTGDGEGIETTDNADTLTINGSVTGANGTAIKLNGGADTVNIGVNATISGIIDGGAGADIIKFAAVKSAATVTSLASYTEIAVNYGAYTNTIRLSNIEQAEFLDDNLIIPDIA